MSFGHMGNTDNNCRRQNWVASLLDGIGISSRVGKRASLSSLTTFPHPGEAEVSFKELTSNSDRRELYQIDHETHGGDALFDTTADNCRSRDCWMPDRLCKSCYECELQFNIFRRRHHCRFCGQVFCHRCASYFVDGTSVFISGTVRACRLCHDQVLFTLSSVSQIRQIASKIDDVTPVYREDFGSRLGRVDDSAIYRVSSSNMLHGLQDRSLAAGTVSPSRAAFSPTTQQLGYLPLSKSLNGQKDITTSSNSLFSPLQLENTHKARWKSAFTETIEANLRRRLLGSSSMALPMAVLSAASDIVESQADTASSRRRLSSCATRHLCDMVKSLVKTVINKTYQKNVQHSDVWSTLVLSMVEQAGKKIKPGDQMDIRPYVRVKLIPGGVRAECSYLNGIVFRKHVLHKVMARACKNPRILLMFGGIEFQRSYSKLAIFNTLLEQEQTYTQIMVEKIVRLQPDLLFVGQAVSRQAQEYLNQHEIIVMQSLKPGLLRQVSRMTGAAITSSTDHVSNMGQLGCPLGHCERFQMLSYQRTCEADTRFSPGGDYLHARGGFNYVYLAGCHKNMGCTLILRGAGRSTLRAIKSIVRFGIYAAYHLRLEVAYMLDSGAIFSPATTICNEDHDPLNLLSTSMGVSFDTHPLHWSADNRKTLGVGIPLSTAYDHQGLLVTSVWMSQHVQCAPAEVKAICFYTPQDIPLGQFLLESCFNLHPRSPHSDRRSMLDITQIFYHSTGRISITVFELDHFLPPEVKLCSQNRTPARPVDRPILIWSYCCKCECVVTPLKRMSADTWNISFGKFLEICFYNNTASCRCGDCRHHIQAEHIQFFGCGNIAARVEYESIRRYGICARNYLPFDSKFHMRKLNEQRDKLRSVYYHFLHQFEGKLLKLRTTLEAILTTKETQLDNRIPTDTSLSLTLEINRFSFEITEYKTKLEEHFAFTLDDCKPIPNAISFPAQFHREFYVRATNWNARLSILGRLQLTLSQNRDTGLSPSKIAPKEDALNTGSLQPQPQRSLCDATITLADGNARNESLGRVIFQNQMDAMACIDAIDAGVTSLRACRSAIIPNLTSVCPNMQLEVGSCLRVGNDKVSGVTGESMYSGNKKQMLQEDNATEQIPAERSGFNNPTNHRQKLSTAFSRLLGKDSSEDHWTVSLDELQQERSGGGLLVHEGQLTTTIIAYSLSSVEYNQILRIYLEKDFSMLHHTMLSPCYVRSVKRNARNSVHPKEDEIYVPLAGQDFKIKSNSGNHCKPGIMTAKIPSSALHFAESLERLLLSRQKSHVKHRFADLNGDGATLCKYVCHAYWATQFAAVRCTYTGLGEKQGEIGYLRSLSMARPWHAQGGKSGATFLKTVDGRFVVKQITRTELQMFLECAPAYFEYLSKSFFHNYHTYLVKVLGVYQIGSHNLMNGKRIMEQVIVMENLFHNVSITRAFDLKGSTRSRYLRVDKDISASGEAVQSSAKESGGIVDRAPPVLLDENFVEFTNGRPLPLRDEGKACFNSAVLNDTLFLLLINVVDYSILVGMNDERSELVVGIIDYMRQYDIIKKVERMGKSVGMIAGQAEPTVIQPQSYRRRFQAAIERYFMIVPDKWTSICMQQPGVGRS